MKRILGIFFSSFLLSVDAFAVSVVGNAGTSGADGVVTLPPDGSLSYSWVSTYGGVNGVMLPYPGLPYVPAGPNGGTGSYNGSALRSDVFAANSGDSLQFYFNYISSDGSGYGDYGWARLLDSTNHEVALLFTARTTPAGSIVPGFGMPSPSATLSPSTVLMIGGAPVWSPLGISSGTCFMSGCGYTDWIKADYTISASGNYKLEYGVVNWNDANYDSGLAFTQHIIVPPSVEAPVPGALWLMSSGLIGLAGISRRKK